MAATHGSLKQTSPTLCQPTARSSPHRPGVIYDMVFTRSEPCTHFAFGDAGVFATMDGFFWTTLCDAIAVLGRPESGFFDPYTDPFDRASYVEFEGRGILRLGALPGPVDQQSTMGRHDDLRSYC